MADRLKGITLEIGGDTQNLSKSLRNVNSDIRNTQSQLKDVQKLLKLDPTNTELLRQKQQLLKAAVSETKEKLEALKKAQETMDANGVDRNSEQYMALQREIADTEQKLKSLETECRNFGSVFSQQLSAVGSKLESVGNKISDVGNRISGAGQKMLPATAAITGLGAVAFNYASDMAESANKVEVAFGSASDRVKQFAETTLDSYGIAKGTSMDMAAQFGDMATSMGLTDDAAANMAMSLVGLSGDLASFKNIGIDRAMTALNGVFTGETESLKALGIVMTQDNLLQYALANGMINTAKSAEQLRKEQIALEKAETAYNDAVKKHGEGSIQAREADLKLSEAKQKLTESTNASLDSLSQAEMVQLRYAYVMDVTKNAHGDFARTSDGAANSMRILQESTKEAAAALGELLIPIITPIIQKITEIVKAVTSLDDTQKRIILTAAFLVAAIGPVLIIIGSVISGVGSIIAGVGGLIKAISTFTAMMPTLISGFGVLIKAVMAFNAALAANPYLIIAVAIIAAVALITYAIVSNFESIKAACQHLWEYIKAGFQQMVDAISTILNVFCIALALPFYAIYELAKAVMNALISMVEVSINLMIAKINSLISLVNSVISALASLVGISFGGIKQIGNVNLPKLAKGGEVLSGTALVGEAGPELLTVSGGRAVVTPLTATADGGSIARVMGSQQIKTDVGISFQGSLSQLAAVLQPVIVVETKRIGPSFTK